MKLTKFEHACLVLENENKTLVVDPGGYSLSFDASLAYDYVVITHEHGDHINDENVKALYDANPSVHFFVNQNVYDLHLKKYSPKHTIIDNGVTAKLEGFELAFTGHDHAIIYQTVPCQNNGVFINNTLYYPGDSFALPDAPIDVLAMPAGAPWYVTAEAIDFVKAVKPKSFFLTHDATLSDIGKGFIAQFVQGAGADFDIKILSPEIGKSIEL